MPRPWNLRPILFAGSVASSPMSFPDITLKLPLPVAAPPRRGLHAAASSHRPLASCLLSLHRQPRTGRREPTQCATGQRLLCLHHPQAHLGRPSPLRPCSSAGVDPPAGAALAVQALPPPLFCLSFIFVSPVRSWI